LGGGTSLIGDPGGRRSERPLLAPEQIVANAAAIRGQLERFLRFGGGPADAVLLNNADWLCAMGLTDFLRDVGKHFTVNAMMAKESVRTRLEDTDHGISFTEFSYMLLQAYDFLHLLEAHGCRLQVGGSDQWGNITAGVDLVRRVRSEEAYGLTWPLVTKADGTKFGKSEAGNVWLDPARTTPYQFFQFWMNTDDRDAGRYLRMYTFLHREQIEALEAATASDPAAREAQRVLAMELTSAVHGAAAAQAALDASAALFGGDLGHLGDDALAEVFADAPSSRLDPGRLDGDGALLVDLLAETGLVASKSAARQAVAQGGVTLNGRREHDLTRRVARSDLLAGGYLVLRRGKRSYHVLRVP
ncbi:MAG: tyrosine--tRNA ligase, partial [Actinobacteria bacterium]|nr:tyrosine--tRNA ligase [Actinomycetota bacterium]